MSEFDEGFLVGLLVGEGHFGGDGRQPQITLRMHARHEALFRWLERRFPGGRLYGPYEHSGRRYYQWMVRGAYLRDVVLPLLERHLTPTVDRYAYDRLTTMRETYPKQLGQGPARSPTTSLHGTDPSSETSRGDVVPSPAQSKVSPAPSVPPSDRSAPGGDAARRDAAAIFSSLREEAPTS